MSTSEHDHSSPAMGSTNSPEYVAFRKCYEELVTAISTQVGTFCDALFAKGFISESVRDFTRNRSVLDGEKAEKLVDTVIDRIKFNPKLLSCFIEIVRGPSTDEIADKLQHYYDAECKRKQSSQAQKNDEESSGDESFHSFPDDDGFICPFCEKCSIEQFFSEEGCPNRKQETLFPHLNTSSLSVNERASLEMQLSSDAQKMITRFADFTVFTRKSLREQNEPLEEIIDTVLSLEAFNEGIGAKVLEPEDQKEIRAASSVARIFTVLRSYISFFNYEIMEHLIKHHGSTEDQKRLEEYLNAFNAFCQRSIFEVPPKVFCNSPCPPGKVFALKCTDQSRVTSLESAQRVKQKVAKVFGLNPLALRLCWLKKGCVELHFLISAAVADHIFPVSPHHCSALSEIGVQILSIEEKNTEGHM